jgi:hypothetical protein
MGVKKCKRFANAFSSLDSEIGIIGGCSAGSLLTHLLGPAEIDLVLSFFAKGLHIEQGFADGVFKGERIEIKYQCTASGQFQRIFSLTAYCSEVSLFIFFSSRNAR